MILILNLMENQPFIAQCAAVNECLIRENLVEAPKFLDNGEMARCTIKNPLW